jgi:hypothetical protein
MSRIILIYHQEKTHYIKDFLGVVKKIKISLFGGMSSPHHHLKIGSGGRF